VFFDRIGTPFEYEPQGFDLGPKFGRYLPDFYLPDIGLWVEIKPRDEDCSRDVAAKIGLVAAHHDEYGVVLTGDPMRNLDDDTCWEIVKGEQGADNPYFFCLCPWCGRAGFEFDGRGARVCGWQKHHATEDEALAAIKHFGHWRADDKCYTRRHQVIEAAAIAARQARFEHGECGAMV
jgi:hypothetical protein